MAAADDRGPVEPGRPSISPTVAMSSWQGVMESGLSKIDDTLLTIASCMMWVLMLGTVAGVVARSLLKAKFTGLFEVSAAYLFIGIVMLVLGVLQAKDEHIRITLLVERSRPRGRAAWGLFAYLLGAVVCATVAYYAWILLVESIRTGALVPALVDLPLWVSRLLIFVGYVSWTVHFLQSASIAYSNIRVHSRVSDTSAGSDRSSI